MTEQTEQTITTLVKQPPKQKDPRRVAAGKKLALISREAKARKKEERENFIKQEAKTEYIEILIVGGIAVLGGLIYYFTKEDVVAQVQTTTTVPTPQVQKRQKREIYSMDDD